MKASSVALTVTEPPLTVSADRASMPLGESASLPPAALAFSRGAPVVVMVTAPPLIVTRGSGSSAVSAVLPSLLFQEAVMPLSRLVTDSAPSLMATKPSAGVLPTALLSLPFTLMPLPAGAVMPSCPPSITKAWAARRPSLAAAVRVSVPLRRRTCASLASACLGVALMASEPLPLNTTGPSANSVAFRSMALPSSLVRALQVAESVRVLMPVSSMKAVCFDCRFSAGPSPLAMAAPESASL